MIWCCGGVGSGVADILVLCFGPCCVWLLGGPCWWLLGWPLFGASVFGPCDVRLFWALLLACSWAFCGVSGSGPCGGVRLSVPLWCVRLRAMWCVRAL
ncbi:unnamed protein product [Absidia cylindrospora]